MSLSNSVLRQYTPPTCTLEIMDRTSRLPGGGRRGIAADLWRFILRFDDPRLSESQRVSVSGDRRQLRALHQAVTAYVQDLLKQSPTEFNARLSPVNDGYREFNGRESLAKTPIAPAGKIYLQPGAGLNNNLYLGSLENPESGAVLQLSLLQLFDLVTALDECAADMVEVPAPTRRRLISPSSAWAGIAAVLLLAVGVTTAVILLNRNSRRQVATNTTAAPPSPNLNQLPPIPAQPSSLPASPGSPRLSSSDELPLPSSVRSIPSPSSKLSLSPKTKTQRNSPATGSAPLGVTTAIPPFPASNYPAGINPTLGQTQPGTIISGATNSPKTSNSRLRHKTQPRSSENNLPGSSGAALPTLAPTPLPESSPTYPGMGTTPPNASSLGQNTYTPTPRALTSKEPKTTAFDTIPQVAEIRNYFKQHWEPPAGLNQTLEYSIILDTDGTIQRIIPLGQAARTYVDRTGMPLIGEHFVSPVKNGQTPTIRLVLSPDGQVQTFLESD